jgi:hypothetical protein
MIERDLGIPSMVITRRGFTQVAANAFAGIGFAADGPMIYEFPMEMFVAGSDLTPINENIDKIVYGLTKWEPDIKELGIYAPSKITVEGKDYEKAVASMNHLFLKNSWSDALPLSLATEERVNWLLTGTDLPRDTVVGEGKILPRGGISTVETLAVALAMAGGRPEYLPVLIAAVEAIIDTECTHQGWQATTSSVFPVVIVNGPIAKDIRLNSGYGLLGPHPMYPANGPIGRAIRFLLQNVGGAIPGIGTMAIYGTNRHTNLVFAEDEDGLPEGWEPLSVDQGFPKGSNTVSHLVINSHTNLQGITGQVTIEQILLMAVAGIVGPHRNISYASPAAQAGVFLLPSGIADMCADIGWSKRDTQNFLWENAKTPWSLIEGYIKRPDTYEALIKRGLDLGWVAGEPWPIAVTPDRLPIVVAGGVQGGHCHWLGRAQGPLGMVSYEIKLPAKDKWDALLGQAEEDLGPIPSA